MTKSRHSRRQRYRQAFTEGIGLWTVRGRSQHAQPQGTYVLSRACEDAVAVVDKKRRTIRVGRQKELPPRMLQRPCDGRVRSHVDMQDAGARRGFAMTTEA